MNLMLRASMVEHVADADPSKKWAGRWLEVVAQDAQASGSRWQHCEPKFHMMCSAIMSDIQTAEGSGAATLHAIQRVKSSLSSVEALGGNAWYTLISKAGVRFEGQYDQGEGGEVTLAQFKLAVETYVRFIADPECTPIEVVFPVE